MRDMTEKFLDDAFSGESQAHMKYEIFASKARDDGLNELARMFKAIAYAEKVHAGAHMKALGKLKSNVDNIQSCIDGERFEIDEMYPAYHEVARLQDEKDAVRTTRYALEAEKIHLEWFEKAKTQVESGKDIEVGTIQVCGICGHTREGEAPEKCPICGASKNKFLSF